MNKFAAHLADRTDGDELAGGRVLPELFLELAPCDVFRNLAILDLAFRDGPSASVTMLPERSARMDEQDLGHSVAQPVEQEPRGLSRHTWILAYRGPQ